MATLRNLDTAETKIGEAIEAIENAEYAILSALRHEPEKMAKAQAGFARIETLATLLFNTIGNLQDLYDSEKNALEDSEPQPRQPMNEIRASVGDPKSMIIGSVRVNERRK